MKLHIDDPVGAVGVHMANGIWGTVAVGLLATPSAPAGLSGLLYTGSFFLLGIQLLGLDDALLWAAKCLNELIVQARKSFWAFSAHNRPLSQPK